jgi:membrane protein DedA with SNARE-associated domain
MPGRLTLVAAGALAATGAADLGAIIVLAAAGALLGDHLWYLVGRFGGGRITALYCRITRQADDCEARAVGCFASYGGMRS